MSSFIVYTFMTNLNFLGEIWVILGENAVGLIFTMGEIYTVLMLFFLRAPAAGLAIRPGVGGTHILRHMIYADVSFADLV